MYSLIKTKTLTHGDKTGLHLPLNVHSTPDSNAQMRVQGCEARVTKTHSEPL